MSATPDTPARTLTIRRAVPADAIYLTQAVLAVADESEGRQLDADLVRSGIGYILAQPPETAPATYWIAETPADGTTAPKAIGSLMITTEWSDWHARLYWWIQSVYVTPAWRGKGVLPQLLDALTPHAQAAHVAELRLYVDEQNTRALAAYSKCNFKTEPYRIMSRPIPSLEEN
jgi:ribosomal protein S18 acetylase RimI-like enzyme